MMACWTDTTESWLAANLLPSQGCIAVDGLIGVARAGNIKVLCGNQVIAPQGGSIRLRRLHGIGKTCRLSCWY